MQIHLKLFRHILKAFVVVDVVVHNSHHKCHLLLPAIKIEGTHIQPVEIGSRAQSSDIDTGYCYNNMAITLSCSCVSPHRCNAMRCQWVAGIPEIETKKNSSELLTNPNPNDTNLQTESIYSHLQFV